MKPDSAPTGPGIPDTLADLAIDIDSVKPHPENPNSSDVQKIAASLSKHGQYLPIVYQQSTGHVIVHNHVWKAAKSLGWPRIAAVPAAVDDNDARRIMIMDNRAGEWGKRDDQVLAEILTILDRTPAGLDGTGYDDAELSKLLDAISDDLVPDFEPTDDAGSRLDRSNNRECPSCGHVWYEDAQGNPVAA